MLTGRRFRILRSTVALDAESMGSWGQVPAGAIVEVTGGSHAECDRLVNLLWDGCPISMFATDLKASMEIEARA